MLVTLAVEDGLSESVARRLVNEYAHDASIIATLGFQGNQYLRERVRNFNQIAAYTGPVIVLTDLDRPGAVPLNLWLSGLGTYRPTRICCSESR